MIRGQHGKDGREIYRERGKRNVCYSVIIKIRKTKGTSKYFFSNYENTLNKKLENSACNRSNHPKSKTYGFK